MPYSSRLHFIFIKNSHFFFFSPFLRYWHLKSGWKISTRLQNKLLKSGNVWNSFYLNLLAMFGVSIPLLCFTFDVGTVKHNLLFRKVRKILLVKHLRGVNLLQYVLILLMTFVITLSYVSILGFKVDCLFLWCEHQSNKLVDFDLLSLLYHPVIA